MIADRHLVLAVHRVTVRCDECARQVSIFVGGTGLGSGLGEQLANVGWSMMGTYADGETTIKHYCPEHSS